MLFVLGVGSAVGLQSSIVTNLMDISPKTKQWKMAGICSLLGFLIGLIYITPGGQYMLQLVDYFGGTFLIFALAIFELVGIFWIYCLENIEHNLICNTVVLQYVMVDGTINTLTIFS